MSRCRACTTACRGLVYSPRSCSAFPRVCMSFDIRPAVPLDAAAACHVLRRTIVECCVQDHQNDPDILAAWLGNKHPAMVTSWLESPTNHTLVAVQGEQVVGVALLTG